MYYFSPWMSTNKPSSTQQKHGRSSSNTTTTSYLLRSNSSESEYLKPSTWNAFIHLLPPLASTHFPSSLPSRIFEISPVVLTLYSFGRGNRGTDEALYKSKSFQSHALGMIHLIDLVLEKMSSAALHKIELCRLTGSLRDLGRRHIKSYGVSSLHFSVFETAVLRALKRVLGEAFTTDAHKGWAVLLKFISEAMMIGVRAGIEPKISTATPSQQGDCDIQGLQGIESTSQRKTYPECTHKKSLRTSRSASYVSLESFDRQNDEEERCCRNDVKTRSAVGSSNTSSSSISTPSNTKKSHTAKHKFPVPCATKHAVTERRVSSCDSPPRLPLRQNSMTRATKLVSSDDPAMDALKNKVSLI